MYIGIDSVDSLQVRIVMYFLANQFPKFSDIEENGEREEISTLSDRKMGKS